MTKRYDAWKAGYDARTQGKTLDDSSHHAGSHDDYTAGWCGLHMDWKHGWRTRDAELKVQPDLFA